MPPSPSRAALKTNNTMTNEEMAKDLVGRKPLSSMITTADLEKLAVEMAEWKEQQFSIERKQLIEKANQAVTQSFENGAIFKKQQMIDKAWDWILRYSPLEFQKEMEKVFRKAILD